MNHISIIKIIAISFLFSLWLSACEDDRKPTLSKKDLIAVDTIYKNQISGLRKTLDSICDARHDSLVVVAADSMIIIRLKEIAKQRARFEKQAK